MAIIGFTFQSFFLEEFPYTHDGENHLARFANYVVALKEGQFPPRFAPNLFNGYGYPAFNYNYPLANMLSIPFSATGLSYEVTFKILVFLSLLSASMGVFAYLSKLQSELPTSWQAKIFTALAYASTPFIVSAVLYRGTIGEIFAYGILPWLLWSVEEVIIYAGKKQHRVWLIVVCIWTAFFLSHNVSVLFGTAGVLLYAAARLKRDLLAWKALLLHIGLAMALASWFWLPAYFEKGEVIVDSANIQQNFAQHFATLEQLLFSPIQFGFSYAGSADSLSFNLGGFGLLALLLACIHFLTKTQSRNSIVTLHIFTALTLIFLQLEISRPLWEVLPLAHYIQFPWRLALFFNVAVLPLIASSYELHQHHIYKMLLWTLLVAWIVQVNSLRPVDSFSNSNEYYQSFTQSTSTANENLPKTFTLTTLDDMQKMPLLIDSHTLEPIAAEGLVSVHSWNGTERSYTIQTEQPVLVVEPTMQFLGWQSWNGTEQLEHIFNETTRGRIAFSLEAGQHTISTRFTQNTPARRLGNTISLITLGFIATAALNRVQKAIRHV